MDKKSIYILLVASENHIIRSIREVLNSDSSRYSLNVAQTLEEAKLQFTKIRPDLVLIDKHLPDGDGLSLLPGFFKDREFPVVVLAEQRSEADTAEAMQDGAMGFIQKTEDGFSNLRQTIDRTLSAWVEIQKRRENQLALERKTNEINQLYKISQLISKTMDLEQIYSILFQSISEFMDCTGLVVSRYNSEELSIYCSYFCHEGKPLDVSGFPVLSLEEEDQGTQSRVIRSGTSLLISDYKEFLKTPRSTFYVNQQGIATGESAKESDAVTRSALIVPMKMDDKVVGVIQVMSHRLNAYESDDLRIVESLASQVAMASNNALLFRVVQEELETRTKAQKELEFMTTHDKLTGLPNRLLFQDRLAQGLIRAEQENKKAAVLMVDLDEFRKVNEVFGYEIGDQLLNELAVRIEQMIHPGDTLARFGDDEYAILMGSIPSAFHAARLAQDLLETISEPVNRSGKEFYVTASIGISVFPDNGKLADDLLDRANRATALAKERGRNNFQFPTREMRNSTTKGLTLRSRLRSALAMNELLLYYQPQVDILQNKIIGVEALIRWQIPDGDLLYPLDFISIAEETGLILPIGEWVMNTACNDLKHWDQLGAPPVSLAVNLSERQLYQTDLIMIIDKVLKKSGVPANRFEIELSENIVFKNIDEIISKLEKIVGLGVKLSLDDFGTGHSTLMHLANSPVKRIKLDGRLVGNLTNRRQMGIIQGIVEISRNLGLDIIVEGVETKEQFDLCRLAGCNLIQGYFFSRPVPEQTIRELLLNKTRFTQKLV